jgi:integrase
MAGKSKSRAAGEGTIREVKSRPGTYEGRVPYRDPMTGARKVKSVYGKSEREVADKMREFTTAARANNIAATSGLTLGELIEHYIAHELPRQLAKKETSQSTVDGKTLHLRKHVPDALRAMRVTDINVSAIRQFDAWLITDAVKPGHTRNSGTRRQAMMVVRNVLDLAVSDRIIPTNPARHDSIKLAKPERVKPPTEAFTTDEVVRILKRAAEGRMYAMWLTLLGTGCRRQDVVGARWANFDLDHEDGTGTWSILSGKTNAAARTIPLGPEVVDALKAHRTRQAAEKLAAKPGTYTDTGVVFATLTGKAYEPHSVTRNVERILTGLGIKGSPHKFRHNYISRLHDAGVPLATIAQDVGHSHPGITLEVYSHAVRDKDVAARGTEIGKIIFSGLESE